MCVPGAGVIRVWDLLEGKLSRSLDPLPRPQTSSSQSDPEDGGEKEEEEEEVPQVYTDLQLCVSRGEMVGVTHDHNIIFYDVATFKKQKQVHTHL